MTSTAMLCSTVSSAGGWVPELGITPARLSRQNELQYATLPAYQKQWTPSGALKCAHTQSIKSSALCSSAGVPIQCAYV